MEKLYIVMPAYNEEANIEDVIKQWYPIVEGVSKQSRLVIADSGCIDRTHEIIEEMSKGQYPQLEAYQKGDKKHGPKVINLYQYAIDANADYIFQTDSDGQTSPNEFEKFWKNRKKYDALLGYRPVRGDGKDRKFVEKVVCILLKMFFGVDVPDANAPFRLMKTSLVEKYIGLFPKDYNLPNIMITTWFKYYGENIKFLPITFKPRQGGKNSINVKSIVKIGWNALGDFMRFRREMKK